MSNTARNPITGAWLKTKAATDSYRSGFDAIFGKKEEPAEEPKPEQEKEEKE